MTALQRLTEWMREQIGVSENPPGSNNVVYNTEYYGGPVNGSQYPWCCAFVWCGFRAADALNLFCGGQKTAWCPFVVNYARTHDQWIEKDYRHGDLLLYDWDRDGVADHIGFLLEAGETLHTIEGNVGDSVRELWRPLTDPMGAYRPRYTEEPAEETPAEENTYVVQPGDTLWGIAQRFRTTVDELVKLNNIKDPNKIWQGQVLKITGEREPSDAKLREAVAELLAEGVEPEKILAIVKECLGVK